MPAFFIDRPVFAWVVALLICLGGLLAIPFLAVAQYPIVAPPSISVSTSYPGASPENLYNSVTRLIEEELNGANGILNFEFDERFPRPGGNYRQFRARHRLRVGLDRGAKPHQARRGAPAARRHSAGHSDRRSLERCAADHHAAVHGRQPRRGRARRFFGAKHFGRDLPHPRGRPGDALLHRARASHLDRSEPVGRVQPDGRRRDQGGKLAKRASRVRQHRGRAQQSAPADIGDGPGQGPIRFAR